MRKLILNMPFEIILLCIPWVLCTAGSTFMDFCLHPDSRHSFPARDNNKGGRLPVLRATQTGKPTFLEKTTPTQKSIVASGEWVAGIWV